MVVVTPGGVRILEPGAGQPGAIGRGGITMPAGFDEDVVEAVPDGAMVEIDPARKALRVLECGLA
jgi:hypothetical protein